jgi:protein-tyrosine phosphatase
VGRRPVTTSGELDYRIDTHVHILPGVDDGPASMADSVALARALVEDGVGSAVATPHLRPDHPAVVPDELAARCDELRAALRHEGVALDIVVGAEVDLLVAADASDADLRLASYGQRGDYLLVETPYTHLPRHFEESLFELALRGFSLVLAHPERNEAFQSDLARARRLAEGGTLLQVTASSLLQRSSSGRAARALVASGYADLIASDSHGVDRYGRVPLSEGERAAHELAPERASWMVRDAPAAVLAGSVPRPPPVRRRRAGWRRLLRRNL